MDNTLNRPLTRSWTSLLDTVIKSSEAHSATLPDSEKAVMHKNTVLRAILVDDLKDYWRVSDAIVDGAPLPPNLTYLHKQQWTLSPEEKESPLIPARMLEEQAPIEVPKPPVYTAEAAVISSIAPTVVAQPNSMTEPTSLSHKKERRLFAKFRSRLSVK
jgi:hypothetical protein